MKIIDELVDTRDKILTCYELPEASFNKSYAPGKWTVRQILHHLADAESVLYDRIRRAIARPKQVVWGFDQDAWAVELGYDQAPLSLSADLFRSVRNAIIYQAKIHYTTKGHHEIVHSGDGKKSLKDVFDKVVWHSRSHLDQIEQALSQ